MPTSPHTIVVGAGIGGLTAAALLLQAGQRVTVLEAHVYPGGSAGTFYHKGYRFDAVLAKAKAIPDLNRRYDYLTNQASKVHLFRLRVPVRNVDPSAYQ